MNRTQKKCLIASTAFHGSLVLLLIFGSALMPEDRPAASNRITVLDLSKITDGPTRGGSSGPTDTQPPAAPPPVAPPQPPVVSQPSLPQPPQQQPQRQEQPKPVARQQDFTPAPAQRPDTESFKPAKPKTVQQDDFTPVDRPPVKQVASNDTAADAKARAAAERQQRIASQIKSGIGHLSSSLSKDTAVQISSGADGGAAAANYGDIVRSTYYDAWTQPASVDASATVIVKVTIARDGHVVSHEILRPSGNPIMDRSIENTLDNVTFIAPFPDGSNDTERPYTIKFILSPK